jgi:hypothetical protein
MYEDTRNASVLDDCFASLQKSLEKKPDNYTGANGAVTDHDLDSIRDDPRYGPILEKGIEYCDNEIRQIESVPAGENKRLIDKQLSDLHFVLARCYAQKHKRTADGAQRTGAADNWLQHMKKSLELRADRQDKKDLLGKAKDEPEFKPLLTEAVLAELDGMVQ